MSFLLSRFTLLFLFALGPASSIAAQPTHDAKQCLQLFENQQRRPQRFSLGGWVRGQAQHILSRIGIATPSFEVRREVTQVATPYSALPPNPQVLNNLESPTTTAPNNNSPIVPPSASEAAPSSTVKIATSLPIHASTSKAAPSPTKPTPIPIVATSPTPDAFRSTSPDQTPPKHPLSDADESKLIDNISALSTDLRKLNEASWSLQQGDPNASSLVRQIEEQYKDLELAVLDAMDISNDFERKDQMLELRASYGQLRETILGFRGAIRSGSVAEFLSRHRILDVG